YFLNNELISEILFKTLLLKYFFKNLCFFQKYFLIDFKNSVLFENKFLRIISGKTKNTMPMVLSPFQFQSQTIRALKNEIRTSKKYPF
ncbi:hypothetical protein M153_20210001, partial [Pseudoloma neurophilia]